MNLVQIKALCRRANVKELEAGRKGVTLAFRGKSFANPAAQSDGSPPGRPRPRSPRHAHRVTDEFDKLDDRLAGTLRIMREIATIAGKRG
jgi:transcription-repair coupling factor (superfamily II helicase)